MRFDPEALSHGKGPLRLADPRSKLLAVLILLTGISVAGNAWSLSPVAVLVSAGFASARLSLRRTLAHLAAVLVFTLPFVIFQLLAGDNHRASQLLAKTLISAGVVFLFTAVTPLSEVLAALTYVRAPLLLTEIIQFIYRYTMVLADEALRMKDAILCRGGQRSLPAAAGAVGILFARALQRAEGLHRAMLSRGYNGRLPEATVPVVRSSDALLPGIALIAVCLLPGWRLLVNG